MATIASTQSEPAHAGTKRRVVLLALVAAALTAAIVVTLVTVLTSGAGQGPLVTHSGGIRFAQPAALGRTISVSGPLVVENTGDRAVVLDRVELVGLHGVSYRGAYVLPWPPKQTPFTARLSYHVPRDGLAMPGATLAPHSWEWIVIGLAAKRGQHQWTRADIVYRYRGATYRRHADVAGAVCAPFKTYKASCAIPSAP